MILYQQISFLNSQLNTEVTEPQSYKKTIYIKLSKNYKLYNYIQRGLVRYPMG